MAVRENFLCTATKKCIAEKVFFLPTTSSFFLLPDLLPRFAKAVLFPFKVFLFAGAPVPLHFVLGWVGGKGGGAVKQGLKLVPPVLRGTFFEGLSLRRERRGGGSTKYKKREGWRRGSFVSRASPPIAHTRPEAARQKTLLPHSRRVSQCIHPRPSQLGFGGGKREKSAPRPSPPHFLPHIRSEGSRVQGRTEAEAKSSAARPPPPPPPSEAKGKGARRRLGTFQSALGGPPPPTLSFISVGKP